MHAPRSRLPIALLALLAVALLAGPVAADGAKAGDPAPDEVILHIDPWFGAGAAYRFRLTADMTQRTLFFHHAGQILRRNFRSVQVGRDVVASLYETSDRYPTAGRGRRLLTRSTTNLEPKYAIVVINRKRDGLAANGYHGLPFRVSLSAQWQAPLSPGSLYVEDFFVAQGPGGVTCHDVGPVLQKQGADDIALFTGRHPVTSLQVTLHDQPGCRGTNARTFPNPPGNAAFAKLWDHGYGDRTRSLRIRWRGPAPAAPAGALAPTPGYTIVPPAPQFVVARVRGHWQNQFGMRYTLSDGKDGKGFAWRRDGTREEGRGVFRSTTEAEIRWTDDAGRTHGPISARIEHDGQYVATRILADNGIVFTRR